MCCPVSLIKLYLHSIGLLCCITRHVLINSSFLVVVLCLVVYTISSLHIACPRQLWWLANTTTEKLRSFLVLKWAQSSPLSIGFSVHWPKSRHVKKACLLLSGQFWANNNSFQPQYSTGPTLPAFQDRRQQQKQNKCWKTKREKRKSCRWTSNPLTNFKQV